MLFCFVCFFKQKTAYQVRISDWIQTCALPIFLGGALAPVHDNRCPHLWLPMSELDAERLAARALRANVALTPPSAPIVDNALISGVRLCMGAEIGRASGRERVGKYG